MHDGKWDGMGWDGLWTMVRLPVFRRKKSQAQILGTWKIVTIWGGPGIITLHYNTQPSPAHLGYCTVGLNERERIIIRSKKKLGAQPYLRWTQCCAQVSKTCSSSGRRAMLSLSLSLVFHTEYIPGGGGG